METKAAADVIPVEAAVTLDGLFRERVKRTPDLIAYRYYDEKASAWREHTWAGMSAHVARWQAAMERDGLVAGDRIAIWLRNSPEWVMCDIAALGLGLVVVPLYTQDRPDNIAYILNNAGCKMVLFEGAEQWAELATVLDQLGGLVRLVAVKPLGTTGGDPRLQALAQWLPASGTTRHGAAEPTGLATIVYTSGTTGRPKGVMLSHRNILSNAYAALTGVMATTHD